jgi:hypothetical protein
MTAPSQPSRLSRLSRAMSPLGNVLVGVGALCLGVEPAILSATLRCCLDSLSLTFAEHV